MSQQPTTQSTCAEADLHLALSDINCRRVQSRYHAARILNVPESTLKQRRAGRRLRRDCEANAKHFNNLEEDAIFRRILEESTRGFAPTKAGVGAMADKLLHERGSNTVGKNWVDNFGKRTPEL